MIQYRPFRNTDPPQLAEIWRSQPTQRGLMQPMAVAVLERFVLAKPTFDRAGLIVAADGDRLLGFAHAGFGPTRDETRLTTEAGVTSIVMTRPDIEPAVGNQLLFQAEAYLTARGARVLYGGGNYPLTPFYHGLYGGSEISGILDSDERMQGVFRGAGYQEARRTLVLHRDLAGFRPLVDRQQMQIRRHTTLVTRVDPDAATWWAGVIFEPFERTQCVLLPREGGDLVASVYFWTMETMVGTWGVHAVGVVGLEVPTPKRRQGLATYLLGESLRYLHTQGAALAEAHVVADNGSSIRLFRNLGFEEVDQAVLFRKDAPA